MLFCFDTDFPREDRSGECNSEFDLDAVVVRRENRYKQRLLDVDESSR